MDSFYVTEVAKVSIQMAHKKEETRVVDVIFGAHPIIEALKAKRRKINGLYTTNPQPRAWDRIQEFLPKYAVPVKVMTKDALDKFCGTTDHMGVAATFSTFPFRKNMFDPAKSPKILLLDAIQDVRNLGAILRSVFCTGIDGVVMCSSKGAPLTGAALKSSAGLAEYLEIYQAPSIKFAVAEIKKAGYGLYMAVAEGGKPVHQVEFTQPWCLVIGNEEKGIEHSVRKEGIGVTLVQRASDSSYNASVAAGILMYLAVNRS